VDQLLHNRSRTFILKITGVKSARKNELQKQNNMDTGSLLRLVYGGKQFSDALSGIFAEASLPESVTGDGIRA
jgi:hypothetical protein